MTGPLPSVAVLLCTRARPGLVMAAVDSILTQDYPCFTLTVVDQSPDNRTALLLAPLAEAGRLVHLPLPSRGLAAARNAGIAAVNDEIIAFTDDDCTACAGWLAEGVACLRRDGDAGILLGAVRAAPHDRGIGFIPCYHPPRERTARNTRRKPTIEGIGANMFVRRRLWEELHGFDELMGVGSRFVSAEETDFILRALEAGKTVRETTGCVVVHHGLRRWDESRDLVRGHLYGLGAMYGKHLRCGRPGILSVLRQLAARWAFGRPLVDFGRLPPRGLRLMAFARGFMDGRRHPLDRQTCLFRAPEVE